MLCRAPRAARPRARRPRPPTAPRPRPAHVRARARSAFPPPATGPRARPRSAQARIFSSEGVAVVVDVADKRSHEDALAWVARVRALQASVAVVLVVAGWDLRRGGDDTDANAVFARLCDRMGVDAWFPTFDDASPAFADLNLVPLTRAPRAFLSLSPPRLHAVRRPGTSSTTSSRAGSTAPRRGPRPRNPRPRGRSPRRKGPPSPRASSQRAPRTSPRTSLGSARRANGRSARVVVSNLRKHLCTGFEASPGTVGREGAVCARCGDA